MLISTTTRAPLRVGRARSETARVAGSGGVMLRLAELGIFILAAWVAEPRIILVTLPVERVRACMDGAEGTLSRRFDHGDQAR